MPRFPVPFGKRKQAVAVEEYRTAPTEESSSFRVMNRSEVVGSKGSIGSIDSLTRLGVPGPPPPPPKSLAAGDAYEDNIFANVNSSRGSGVSNVTKATDNSSRHSNASTAPSSSDMALQDDARHSKRAIAETPVPAAPTSKSGWSLRNAGRTFSFGGQKKPAVTPETPQPGFMGRERSKTASTTATSTTATPPKINNDEFDLDLGGDFSGMFNGAGFDKRASIMQLKKKQQQDQVDGRQALAPRSLTGNMINQPQPSPPMDSDQSRRLAGRPYSGESHDEGDHLMKASPIQSPTNENAPPVPRHGAPFSRMARTDTDSSLQRSSAVFGRSHSSEDDADALLLKQSVAASKFLANAPPPPPVPSSSGRYRRNEDTFGPGSRQVSSESRSYTLTDDGDNLFDGSPRLPSTTRITRRNVASKDPVPSQNKVMTPAEFEKYRRDKGRKDVDPEADKDNSDEDEVNYDDDEDEVEKSRQMAKQRRKQEANMAVYRQQMMKVTGESPATMSTPNLTLSAAPPASSGPPDNGSDEDEEIPLAILAAHGFPNKNRAPARLSHMSSNPNMKQSIMGPPTIQRPESAAGSLSGGGPSGTGRLPAFARGLPQDPYGIVNSQPRESIQMSGGAAAGPGGGALPPGGLVGVIANEERTRAMRRGSPSIDARAQMSGGSGFDPTAGIPPQMMYPQQPAMTPGEVQMNQQMQQMQQMQQFMQMQMQFMNMMGGGGGQQVPGSMQPGLMTPGSMPSGGLRPASHVPSTSMGMGMDMNRRSHLDPGFDSARGDASMRTMSMVHPSSASIYGQPMMGAGAPSIHIQGQQYAPSIAPSERSNIGLPGRYRPVSSMPPAPMHDRTASMSSAAGLGGRPVVTGPGASKVGTISQVVDDDDDDEEGWAKMKAKRETKKSMWKNKKSFGSELGALIS